MSRSVQPEPVIDPSAPVHSAEVTRSEHEIPPTRPPFWQSTRAVHLLLFLMVVVWGFNLPIIKVSMQEMRPLAFTSLRFVMSSVILLCMQGLRRERIRVNHHDWGVLILVGLLSYAGYQIVFSYGISLASATTSSLVLALVPIMVALLSAAFHLEQLSWRGWLGALACFAGIVVVVLGGKHTSGSGNLLGDALVFVAAAFWAVSTVLTRPVLGRYSIPVLTTVTMLLGTVALLPAALPDILRQDWAAISLQAWLGLVYSAVLASAAANILWNIGLHRLGGTSTAVYTNVTPVFSIVAAWFMLGERITWMQIAGAAVVFVGLRLTQTRRPIPAPQPVQDDSR